MFVTPRRWQGKADWATQKRDENDWHDVQAYDADDLEQWLDRHPAVAAWAARTIASAPEGLRDLEEVWDDWAARTSPIITPGLLTAGRVAEWSAVRQWLDGPPTCIRIRADTVDEGIGFLAAIVQRADEPQRDRLHSRALVVTNPETWRAVAGQRTPLTIIATSAFGGESQAVSRGHHVAVVYGNDSVGVTVDISLPHPRRGDLVNALRQMGLGDDRCGEIAAESRGHLAAVVDRRHRP